MSGELSVEWRVLGPAGSVHVFASSVQAFAAQRQQGIGNVECRSVKYGVPNWTDVTRTEDWMRVNETIEIWMRTYRERDEEMGRDY